MTKAQRKSNARKQELRRRKKPKRQPKISRGPHGLSIPEAGAMIGLGRAASYQAAGEGKIPVLEFGALKIVPRAKWLQMLGADVGATDAA
jgi:hypothetical protein